MHTAMFDGVVSGESAFVGAESRRRWYLPMKQGCEWFMAALMLLVLGPVIGLLAMLVKMTSPGPAFYWQVRLGRGGKPYRIYKLRSMANNCEAKTGAVWSSGEKDPRVTKLGRFLRETHLDELPQLWNVVRGDMNLVGPRPERPEIASRLERALPGYRYRVMLKPGVTGLAQVQLPPDTDLESVRRKLGYDLHYVREVNVVMDAKILFSTLFLFMASGINACARALVNAEKNLVEGRDFGGLKAVAGDGWRVGAA